METGTTAGRGRPYRYPGRSGETKRCEPSNRRFILPIRPACRCAARRTPTSAPDSAATPPQYAELQRGPRIGRLSRNRPGRPRRLQPGVPQRPADGRSGFARLCARVDAKRVLLADVTVDSVGVPALPSACWPDVTFTVISRRDGRVHKDSSERLEPHRLDSFDHEQFFARHAQAVVASQGHFPKTLSDNNRRRKT